MMSPKILKSTYTVRIAATNSLYFKNKPVNDIIINILAMKYGGGEKNPSKNKYLLPWLVGKGKRLEITANLSMIKLQGKKLSIFGRYVHIQESLL